MVESVGEDVNEVKEGDTVIPTFMADCGDCKDCLSNKSNLCSKLPFSVSPGLPRCGTTRFTDLNGEVIHHFLFVSSFSEYTVVDVANVTKVDPAIPPNRACLLSCGVSTGLLLTPLFDNGFVFSGRLGLVHNGFSTFCNRLRPLLSYLGFIFRASPQSF